MVFNLKSTSVSQAWATSSSRNPVPRKNCQICNSSSVEAALRARSSSTEYAFTFFSVYLCRSVIVTTPCARRNVTTPARRFATVRSSCPCFFSATTNAVRSLLSIWSRYSLVQDLRNSFRIKLYANHVLCARVAATVLRYLVALAASAAFRFVTSRGLPPSLAIDGIAQAKHSAIGVKLFLVGFPVGALAAHSLSNPQAHDHDFFL